MATLDAMISGRRLRHVLTTCLTGAALAALALLGLAACTHNSTPTPTPSSSSVTPTSTATPTATPPVAPKAAPTRKSAEAFVRYFWAVYNYSYVTLDSHQLLELSESECKFCASSIAELTRLKTTGAHIEGTEVKIVSIAAPSIQKPSRLIVATVVSQAPGRTVDSDGTVHEITGIKQTLSSAAIHWVDGSWRVRGISVDKIDKK